MVTTNSCTTHRIAPYTHNLRRNWKCNAPPLPGMKIPFMDRKPQKNSFCGGRAWQYSTVQYSTLTSQPRDEKKESKHQKRKKMPRPNIQYSKDWKHLHFRSSLEYRLLRINSLYIYLLAAWYQSNCNTYVLSSSNECRTCDLPYTSILY